MRVPKFKNIEEEAEFWDRTDTSEILSTGKLVKADWESPGKCPICQTENLRYRFIDIDMLDGAVTFNGIEIYYCPLCKKTIVPKTTQNEIRDIIRRLQLIKEEISITV